MLSDYPLFCLLESNYLVFDAVLRGEDPLQGRPGAAQVLAGLPGEAEDPPGPLRNDGAAAGHPASVHAGELPGAGGRFTALLLFDFALWKL